MRRTGPGGTLAVLLLALAGAVLPLRASAAPDDGGQRPPDAPAAGDAAADQEPVQELRLAWRRDGLPPEVDAWLERDVLGRVVPDDGVLPPEMGERLSLPVDEGRIRVPIDAATRAVVVVDGEHRARWERLPGTAGLSLASGGYVERGAVTVRVRVLDPSGAPLLGAPVAVLARDGATLSGWGGSGAVTSLPDGVAVLTFREQGRWGHTPELFVALRSLTARLHAVPLPPPDARDAVIDLTSPATGRLLVEVRGPDGAAVDGPLRASLDLALPWNPASAGGVYPSQVLEDGRAEFRLVPAGVPVTVLTGGESHGFAVRSAPVQVSAGGTATVRLELSGPRPHVTGSVSGPLPVGTTVRLDLSSRSLAVSGGGTCTAEERVFDLELGGHEAPALPQTLVLRAWASAADGRVFHGSAEARLERWPASGVIEVGEIAMDLVPLLVRGCVRDTSGAPVRDAYVRVEWQDEQGEWRRSSCYGGSDADGVFALRGAPPPGRLRVLVDSVVDGVLAAAAFETGRTGVELEVPVRSRPGYLRASLRLPAGVERTVGWMRAWPAGSAPGERSSAWFSPGVDVQLGAGTWSVELGLRGSDEPLATADDVVVRAGETAAPAALQDVDATFVAETVRIRVLDDAGRPDPTAKVWWRVAGAPLRGDGASWWRETRPGRDAVVTVLVAPGDALEVLGTAPGLGWGTLDAARGDVDLCIPALFVRTVRVHVGTSLAIAQERAEVTIQPVVLRTAPGGGEPVPDFGDPRSRVERRAVRVGDEVDFAVTAEGAYGVLVTLSRSRSAGGGSRGVGLDAPSGCVVLAGGTDTAILLLDPPVDRIEDALRRLDDALRGE